MPKQRKQIHNSFTTQCICSSIHCKDADYSAARLHLLSKFRLDIQRQLLSKVGHHQSTKTDWICSYCVTEYIDKIFKLGQECNGLTTIPIGNPEPELDATLMYPDESNTRHDVYSVSLATLHQDIQAMPHNLRASLAKELAATEREHIRADTIIQTRNQGNHEIAALSTSLGNVNVNEKNPILLAFLEGLQGDSKAPCSVYQLCKVIECCMALTVQVAVLPIHFREAILLYKITRSRMAMNVISGYAPHGAYTTIRNWLKKLTAKTDTDMAQADGDSIVIFDNNQVLQRRWQIAAQNTVNCSVITMMVFMEIDPLVSNCSLTFIKKIQVTTL